MLTFEGSRSAACSMSAFEGLHRIERHRIDMADVSVEPVVISRQPPAGRSLRSRDHEDESNVVASSMNANMISSSGQRDDQQQVSRHDARSLV